MMNTILDDLQEYLQQPWVWLIIVAFFIVIAGMFGFPATNFVLNIVQISLICMWPVAAKHIQMENREKLDNILKAHEYTRLELIRIREQDHQIKHS